MEVQTAEVQDSLFLIMNFLPGLANIADVLIQIYVFQDDQDNLPSCVVEAQSSTRSGTAALVVHEKDSAMEVQTAQTQRSVNDMLPASNALHLLIQSKDPICFIF